MSRRIDTENGLRSNDDPETARGRGLVVLGILIGALVLIALAVVALQGTDDEPGDDGGGAFPAAVRDKPQAPVGIDLDHADFVPVARLDEQLIVTDVSPDGETTQVRAIDLGSGKETWRHDARSVAVVDRHVFVVDGGELRRLESDGTEADPSLDVDAGDITLGASARWVLLYGDSGLSLVDPTTLDVLAEDVSADSCSPNGRYCTRVRYDDTRATSAVSVIEVRAGQTGKQVGKTLRAAGYSSAFVTDDGRSVLQDGAELVLHDIGGKELDRAEIPNGAALVTWLAASGLAVVTGDDERAQLWAIGDELTKAGGRGPKGAVRSTARDDTVIVEGDDEVYACRVSTDGFECEDGIGGTLAGIADDTFYVRTDDALEAYDLRKPTKSLWSLDVGREQTISVLAGRIALTSTSAEEGTTVIDVYGKG